ncbi:Pre-mRNA-splicing factor CWC22 homolog [Sergentomyia squamirostris]
MTKGDTKRDSRATRDHDSDEENTAEPPRAKKSRREDSDVKRRESSRERERPEDDRRRRERRRTRSRSRSRSPDRRGRNRKPEESEKSNPEVITERQRRTVDLLTSRTGGAYIPPAKLRMMQAEITDKSSAAYQRIAWEALKKSIHGYINKVNVDNIGIITRELLKENIVRGRGLLCRSIIQAQAASPTFTHVYAALVAVINSKFPNIGELLLKRLVIQFKRGFRRNDKSICISSSRFLAHLVNQRVAHEILSLEILTLLVESPTDDSVEVAIAFLKECGQKLTEVTSKGVNAIFEMLKNILHEGKLDKRVQYMIEVVFQVRKDGFKDHISVIEALELVEEDDQFTHLVMLDEATETQDVLNVFKYDPEYEENEQKYKGLSKELLGSDAESGEDGSDDSDSDSDDSGSSGGEDGQEEKKGETIIDNTETNLVALRRTIYLTIHSSLDYEECAHKLMKMELKPGQEMELCHMFLDCCAEQRTYEKFYGLLAQRFCMINKVYVAPFEEIFRDTYQTTHRLDTNRLRNVSKFFAHLLFTDAIGWDVLECIKLNEEDTTSSSRIFIKILFQELVEYMGLGKLNTRLKEPILQESFAGLFPRDNPKNTRFAINFFTSIGLGGLTDSLREHLKQLPKTIGPTVIVPTIQTVDSSSSSSSSDSSSSSESSSSSSSEESSSESESEKRKKKKTKKKKTPEKSQKERKKQRSPEREDRRKEERYDDRRENRREDQSRDRERERSRRVEERPERPRDRDRREKSREKERDRKRDDRRDSDRSHRRERSRDRRR